MKILSKAMDLWDWFSGNIGGWLITIATVAAILLIAEALAR